MDKLQNTRHQVLMVKGWRYQYMERSERTCSHTTYHREPMCTGCVCTVWYQQHVTLRKAKLQAWKGQQVKRSGQRGLNRKGTENITVVGLL